MKAYKAELFLLLVTLIWGGTFLFTKLGLEYTSPPIYLIIRFSIALLIALLFFGKYIIKIDRVIVMQGILLGLFFGSGFLFQTYGLKYTSVTKSAFITGMSVILTPFVFKIVQKKKLLFWPKIGVVIAFAGLWVFSNPKFGDINIGDVLTLASTIFWAFYIVLMDLFTKERNSFKETIQLVILQLIATIFVASLGLLFIDFSKSTIVFSPNLLISLAYNGIIASFILTLIHTSFQKYTTPVKAALIFSLEPIFASVIAIFAINEILNGREYIGASILLFGVLVSETGDFVYKKIMKSKN